MGVFTKKNVLLKQHTIYTISTYDGQFKFFVNKYETFTIFQYAVDPIGVS